MSGLSYFDDGGEVDAEEQEAPTSRVDVKPTAGKGPYAIGTPVGNVPMAPGVLDAMEQLYRQKLEQQNSFMEAMKDAAAWSSGGIQGPSQALALRAREKEAQAANLFQIQSQLAQFKAAQESAKNWQQGLGFGVTGGAQQPQKGATWQTMIESLPEVMRPQAMDALRKGDSKTWNEIFQKVGMEDVKGLAQPGAAEAKYDIFILDKNGEPELHQVSLPQKQRLIREGKGFEPGSEIPGRLAAPGPAAPGPAAPGPAAPGPAAPGPAAMGEDKFRFENLTPGQIQIMNAKARGMGLQGDVFLRPDAADLFNKQSLDRRKAIFESIAPEAPTQIAAAPSISATDVTAPIAPVAPRQPTRTPPVSSIRAEQEFRKNIDAEMVKLWSKDQEQHVKDNESAGLREINSREIINTLKKDPQIAGILQVPGRASAFATLLKTGISAPGGHSIGIKEIDEVMFKGMPGRTPEEIKARDRLRTLLDTAALHAREILKGGGQISDFEQKMLQSMVGSLDNSPENIVKIHMIFEENAKQRQKLDEAWKASGIRSYGEFKATSPEYKKLQTEYNQRLKQLADEKVTLPKGEVAVHPGRSLLDKYPPKGKKQ